MLRYRSRGIKNIELEKRALSGIIIKQLKYGQVFQKVTHFPFHFWPSNGNELRLQTKSNVPGFLLFSRSQRLLLHKT